MQHPLAQRGFTLIEIIIVSAVLLLFFGGIMLAIQYSLQLITVSRVNISALSLANDRMELVRSLPYNTIGVVAGFPAGPIPQVQTVEFNGFTFTVTTAVQYIDDPADGLGAADSNSITTDYKQIEVTVAWTVRGLSDQVVLKSYATPRSIETNVGGGTIRVNVFDATVAPVSGASVRVFNESGIVYDVTRLTDATGAALFSVASGSAYQIAVSRPGFSTDGTIVPTSTIPNPATSPITVLEAGISTMNFFIDRLSTVAVELMSSVTPQSTAVDMRLPTNWATSSAVTVAGSVTLAETGGVYEPSGTLMTNPITPASIARWEYARLAATTTPATEIRYHFYSSTNTADRIPDADLPGNSAGFTTRVVNLRNLDAGAYPSLVVGFTLTTTDSSQTPTLDSVTLASVSAVTPAATQSFTLRGQKVIGTDASLVPIPKTELSTTTDTAGLITLSDMEWDTYQVLLPSTITFAEACPAVPLILPPNVTRTFQGEVRPATSHSLQLTVVDVTGNPVPAAIVRLVLGGSTIASATTSGCGQVYFPGLVGDPDYRLEITSPDLGDLIVDPVDVSGVVSRTVSY